MGRNIPETFWSRRPNVRSCQDRDEVECRKCGDINYCLHVEMVDTDLCTEGDCPRWDGRRWTK